MKQLLSHTITLISEVAILCIALIWYISGKSPEALITTISTSAGLITTLLVKFTTGSTKSGGIHLTNSNHNIIISDNKGEVNANVHIKTDKSHGNL
ncbi:MAG: hypothetical protein LUD74_01605 [Tannerellaceae bacterium]|nr:hypothetical protein [Tannerellaceae bacterium]MCD8193250.1 hypothetical protein [Tannerellaceae bacterium]